MIAYIDTSVLLRLVLREAGALDEVRACESLVSSELLAVEALRTIDRLRIQAALSTDEAATRRVAVTEWLEAIDLVRIHGLGRTFAGLGAGQMRIAPASRTRGHRGWRWRR